MEVAASNIYARNHNSASRLTALMSANPHSSSSTASHFSTYSQFSNGDSSQIAASSTLLSHPPIPSSTFSNITTPFGANDSLLNRRGDEKASLFQITVSLRRRLNAFPGFEEKLNSEEEIAGENDDPVSVLWAFFRRGYPLMDLYNALDPPVRLEVDPAKTRENQRGKAATFKFITACKEFLGIPEPFMVTDLFGQDTTGFVKVTRVVNQVLDRLVQRGILGPEAAAPSGAVDGAAGIKKTKRQHIVAELVQTERTYVQHLELLHTFKNLVEQKGAISGDAAHEIFHNLNQLLDVQCRFLIRVEQTNLFPEEDQNWGALFIQYQDQFKVYETFIANQKKCELAVLREFNKFKDLGGPPEMQQFVEAPTVLSAFLLKPFQRLSKYPLLLKELRDRGDLDDAKRYDADRGIDAATSVLLAANAAIDREERNEAMAELKDRVEDWKGHRLDQFGDLLLHGNYQVIKGDASNPKDLEREYKIFLFENILLCCKEINSNKPKNKVLGKTDSKGRPKLQLKGRIFMQNVTDTVISAKPGSYTCQIFWKGDPAIEYFTIKFNAEEVMRKWADQLNHLKHKNSVAARASSRVTVVPNDEFYFMQLQQLENPHMMNQEEDDDDYDGTTIGSYSSYPSGVYPMAGNESQTSFRSRSTTGDSTRGPQRYLSNTPLSLQTGMNDSPEQPDSFFSPVSESPISVRSSGLSSFSRGTTPVTGNPWDALGGGISHDHRFTAPAMPRGHVASYQPTTGTPRNIAAQRPSLPPSAHSTQAIQSRLRSASSPDIANPALRRYVADPNQHQGVPPIPDMPPVPVSQQPGIYPAGAYAYAPAPSLIPNNRAQSTSPAALLPHQHMVSLPIRSATQSPTSQQSRTLNGQNQTMPSMAGRGHFAAATAASHSIQQLGITQSLGLPAQLKVKVYCEKDKSSMTLVVSPNITFQILKDRIDVKLQRSSNLSLSSGKVQLKYLDEDDFVSIQSDEDVQMAFETWRDSQKAVNAAGIGEIDLYIQ